MKHRVYKACKVLFQYEYFLGKNEIEENNLSNYNTYTSYRNLCEEDLDDDENTYRDIWQDSQFIDCFLITRSHCGKQGTCFPGNNEVIQFKTANEQYCHLEDGICFSIYSEEKYLDWYIRNTSFTILECKILKGGCYILDGRKLYYKGPAYKNCFEEDGHCKLMNDDVDINQTQLMSISVLPIDITPSLLQSLQAVYPPNKERSKPKAFVFSIAFNFNNSEVSVEKQEMNGLQEIVKQQDISDNTENSELRENHSRKPKGFHTRIMKRNSGNVLLTNNIPSKPQNLRSKKEKDDMEFIFPNLQPYHVTHEADYYEPHGRFYKQPVLPNQQPPSYRGNYNPAPNTFTLSNGYIPVRRHSYVDNSHYGAKRPESFSKSFREDKSFGDEEYFPPTRTQIRKDNNGVTKSNMKNLLDLIETFGTSPTIEEVIEKPPIVPPTKETAYEDEKGRNFLPNTHPVLSRAYPSTSGENGTSVARKKVKTATSRTFQRGNPQKRRVVNNDIIKQFLNNFPGVGWCLPKEDVKLVQNCCEVHQKCDKKINPSEKKFDLKNDSQYTRLHCACEYSFFKCLKRNDNIVSNSLGVAYFNILAPKCYALEHKTKCLSKNKWKKCVKYGYDKSSKERFQWLDTLTY
ncbi:hypothetical protein HHI36_002492 [Cryptolaemus montrouzieri]|uniref:phospholipase A2 n=1 Tax=Cryptolaemus montrouzieri TaxID=559131 RepID=A0ABD2PB54_9CUCU